MDKDALAKLDDHALDAVVLGIVSDCHLACAADDCPLLELPQAPLMSLHDAIIAMPRYDKLALLSLSDCCRRRRVVTDAELRRLDRNSARLEDTTHLIRTFPTVRR